MYCVQRRPHRNDRPQEGPVGERKQGETPYHNTAPAPAEATVPHNIPSSLCTSTPPFLSVKKRLCGCLQKQVANVDTGSVCVWGISRCLDISPVIGEVELNLCRSRVSMSSISRKFLLYALAPSGLLAGQTERATGS